MATLKAIRKRIGSVRSTQQITKAMKMVAAAKLRRAQEAAVASRPYADKLEATVQHLSSRIPESEQRVLLFVIAGDRGLCGGYNVNLGRMAETFLRERGAEVRLITVGR